MRDKAGLILAAAGRGERLGAGVPKQFLKVAGKPIMIHALETFEKHPAISEIVVVVPPGKEEEVREMCRHYALSKVGRVVCGGETRQASVYRGFQHLSLEVGKVLVHDAARPLVSAEMITRVVEALKHHGAVICGVPVRDTIKEVSPEGKILRTLPRERLYLAQTPQGAWRSWLGEAFSWALSQGKEFTDEAALLEAAGFEVHVVPGAHSNLKITYPEDLWIVECFFKNSLDTS